MVLKGSRSGEKKCDNIEAAVEYINKHPNENFVIYDATQEIVKKIKEKVSKLLYENITKG